MKKSSIFIILINIIGVVCLCYFAILYFTHNVEIVNRNGMVPITEWERAGNALTIGFVSLLIVNILNFCFVKIKLKFVRLLSFIPA